MYYFFFERRNQHSHVMGSITPISFNTCQHPPHWISDMTCTLLDSPSTCRIKADAKYAHMYMKMYLFVFACICLVFVHICFVFVMHFDWWRRCSWASNPNVKRYWAKFLVFYWGKCLFHFSYRSISRYMVNHKCWNVIWC